MKIKKRVKKSTKNLTEEEKKAKQELRNLSVNADAQSELNESIYTYYSERTDAVNAASMGQSINTE